MANLPIHWIMARAYCAATEEEDRVVRALDTVCPAGENRRDVLEGQYGNPIVHLMRRIEDSKDIVHAWEIWEDAGLIDSIRPYVDSRTDEEGILHFRIDKQRAFEGTFALAKDEDFIDIQVKIKAYPAREEAIRRVVHDLVAEAA